MIRDLAKEMQTTTPPCCGRLWCCNCLAEKIFLDSSEDKEPQQQQFRPPGNKSRCQRCFLSSHIISSHATSLCIACGNNVQFSQSLPSGHLEKGRVRCCWEGGEDCHWLRPTPQETETEAMQIYWQQQEMRLDLVVVRINTI